MVGGQVLDLEFKRKKKDKKTLDRINRDKTARLFEASAGIGAIASGAANKKIAAMSRFGLSFGMAFQVVDDIIDREGYVKSSGIINARCSSERFIKDAKRALSAFGAEADRLREMADHLLTRKS